MWRLLDVRHSTYANMLDLFQWIVGFIAAICYDDYGVEKDFYYFY